MKPVMHADQTRLTVVEVDDEVDGHAEERHEDVGHGQVDEEVVGDAVHRLLLDDHHDDHDVADKRRHEHHGVRDGVNDDHVHRLFNQRKEVFLFRRDIHRHIFGSHFALMATKKKRRRNLVCV